MSVEPREAPSALTEAAAIILESAGRSLGITVLNKALFKLDLLALLETGTQATDATYVALKAGPVVQSYGQCLVGELERVAIAMQDDDDPMNKPVTVLHAVKPKFLSREHVRLARSTGEWAKGKTATELSKLFHLNPGWIQAWRDGAGQGFEINMRIAMQQVVDDDPWIRAAPTEVEKKVFGEPDPPDLVSWE